MSIAYLLLKQVPRARNLLKRLGKFLWDARNADELERGWILLADVYIQVSMATKILKYYFYRVENMILPVSN